MDPALLTSEQKSKLIHEALAKLPEEERALITAFYFENISIHKLARQLGVSRPAIRYRRRRALQLMKKMIRKSES
ncbi:MAG: sigma factor-like helix-turn-helix DNA-binding protein [Caldisericaceae bacterium]